jgi:hypothetical protein
MEKESNSGRPLSDSTQKRCHPHSHNWCLLTSKCVVLLSPCGDRGKEQSHCSPCMSYKATKMGNRCLGV